MQKTAFFPPLAWSLVAALGSESIPFHVPTFECDGAPPPPTNECGPLHEIPHTHQGELPPGPKPVPGYRTAVSIITNTSWAEYVRLNGIAGLPKRLG